MQSEPAVIRATTSAELLKLVPPLVGVDPRESLVLVAFRGRRTAGAMRIGLPAIDEDETRELARFAAEALGLLLKLRDVDGVVPVVYTDETFEGAPDGPRRALLETVGMHCVRAGLRLKDLLCVAGDGYASLADPGGMRALPLIDLVPDDASRIDEVADPAVLTRLPRVSSIDRDRFAERVEAWLAGDGHPAEVHGTPVDAGFPAPGGLVDRALEGQDVTGFVEHALGPHDPGPICECRALVAALLCAPALRDVVMMQAGWGRRFGRHVELHTLPRRLHPVDDVASILAFAGGDFARPDPQRCERAAAMLLEVAGHLPPEDRAPALATAGWLHWVLGRGSIAGRLMDAALAADPAYGLAEIMTVRLAHGHLPEWAFHPEPGTAVGRRWAVRSAGRGPDR